MKHLIRNNQIILSGIPSHFTRENGEGFWGGYENRTDLHSEDGWRDELIPAFDPILQQLGEIIYDPILDAVTFSIIDRTDLPTIEQAKARKVAEIKQRANQTLSETDWYVIRKVEKAKVIPLEITTERERIRTRSNELEVAVTSFAELREVLMFGIEF